MNLKIHPPKQLFERKTGYAAFVQKTEPRKNGNLDTVKISTQNTAQPRINQSHNLSKEPNWNSIFVTIVITAFVIVGFLRLSGAFDGNIKTESEIRLDAYSECVNMNGKNCSQIFE